jgi:iron(III) transport system ATP-binding protein
MSAIELRSVRKAFGPTAVLSAVDLVVPERSITAVLGASGSGKTTLLRLVAGFDQVDAGTIRIAGETVDDGRRFVTAQRRAVGYVPQEGALFPHLTVAGNVGFGVGRRDRARVGELIDLVGLQGLSDRYPHQLSGGQQQRVALARALAIRPRVVLLDEPFSSLDATLRASVRDDVARILGQTGTTTILVTHDQDEALSMADQVSVLRDGRMIASAAPHELYVDPPDLATATSIGDANVLPAVVHAGRALCALGALPLRHRVGDGDARVLLRPEQLTVLIERRHGCVGATVVEVRYHGHDALVDLVLEHPDRPAVVARVLGELELRTGQHVWVDVQGSARAWPIDDPRRPTARPERVGAPPGDPAAEHTHRR